MIYKNDGKRRCSICRKFHPKCDLNNHKTYGLICKNCYDDLKKQK